MNNKYVYAFFMTMLPVLGFAQGATSYQCNFDNLQRRIEILTEPGVSVPCEVHYYKDSEMPGEKQVLWTASTQAGYCEAKTEEFVAKLREWGWQCTASAADEPAIAPEAAAEPEPVEAAEPAADDTEALEPAE